MTTAELPAHVETPWSRVDEKNWTANRAVLRDLKKWGEEPSEWLAAEYRELSTRRRTRKLEESRLKASEGLQTMAQRLVDSLPSPTPEQCRRVAVVLHASGALR